MPGDILSGDTISGNASSDRGREPFLSVVIPCYNEEKNLQRGVLDEVRRYLEGQRYPWEVVIVNDESTDSSRDLIEQVIAGRENWRLVDIPHGGKPAGIWAGIQGTRGEVVLLTDMDQSTPIAELDRLLPRYKEGSDVVIGSRGSAREGSSLLRRVGSAVFRALRALFLLRGIDDTQCGFKLCRRRVALQLFPHLQFLRQARPAGWKVSAYDVEFLYLCDRAGYRIEEVVVEWRNRDQSDTKGQGGELARYARESIDMAREVIRVNVNRLKGTYDGVGRGAA
jgi:dolichyl-phosphate beta-glucosyltransferase